MEISEGAGKILHKATKRKALVEKKNPSFATRHVGEFGSDETKTLETQSCSSPENTILSVKHGDGSIVGCCSSAWTGGLFESTVR